MVHKYDKIASALATVFEELRAAGLDDVLAKGGVGTLLLAHRLGQFEYKVSITNQFNFNFGPRPQNGDPGEVVHRHFEGIAGAYCAVRQGAGFSKIAFCEVPPLVEDLVRHFNVTAGGQLTKNYSIEAFLALRGAREV